MAREIFFPCLEAVPEDASVFPSPLPQLPFKIRRMRYVVSESDTFSDICIRCNVPAALLLACYPGFLSGGVVPGSILNIPIVQNTNAQLPSEGLSGLIVQHPYALPGELAIQLDKTCADN